MIQRVRDLTYRDRLKLLTLHSLERCWVSGDLVEVLKWIKGFNTRYKNKVLIFKEQKRTRTNGFKLHKFKFKKEIGNKWFTNRIVEECNKLSKHVISART